MDGERKKLDSERPADAEKKPDPASTAGSSLASRIQSSAAGLLRSAVSPPSAGSGSSAFADGVSSTLAALSSSDKAALPSASSSSALPGSAQESSYQRTPSSSEAGFRSHRQQPQARLQLRQSEEAFREGQTADFYEVTGKGKGKGKAREEEERLESAWDSAQPTAPSDRQKQEQLDGRAVSDLLSLDTTQEEGFEIEDADADADLDFLTDQPRPEPGSRIAGTSLVPDVEFVLESLRGVPASSHAEHLRDLPGVAEWLGVDAEYADVVWGTLKPRVEEARREVQQRVDGGELGVGDGPAVTRLRMLLGHLRDRRADL